jgi:hypothetical protein
MRLDDLADRLVRRWTRLYTAGVAAEPREQRRAEIASDVWEHRHEATIEGLRSAQIGLEIAARWFVGIPADLSWRRSVPRVTAAR